MCLYLLYLLNMAIMILSLHMVWIEQIDDRFTIGYIYMSSV